MVLRSIAEKLQIPKSSTVEHSLSQERQFLLGSRQLNKLKEIRERSSGSFDTNFAIAKEVAALVHASLDFAPTGNFTPLLTAESIAKREATNCFGHTVVLSECLEEVGIEHFICYANQHTFVALFDRKSDRAFMVDPLSEHLTCEITKAVVGEDPLTQLELGELRAVNKLYTDEILATLPPSVNKEAFVGSRPWLSFDRDALYRTEPNPRDTQLQLLTLPSIPGRELLIDQYNAMIYANRRDFDASAKIMEDLSGIYLDVDPRNNLKMPTDMVKFLIRDGQYLRALMVVKVVLDSLPPVDTSKNALFLPDTMRKIAKRLGNVAMMSEAVKIIEELPKNNLTKGKLSAARRELAEMIQSNHKSN